MNKNVSGSLGPTMYGTSTFSLCQLLWAANPKAESNVWDIYSNASEIRIT